MVGLPASSHARSAQSLKGHPPGIFLVAATEMWERFSYYGMVGLLVLFLSSPVVNDGFGWDKADAVKLYGIYSGLVFASPALGGWVSSRYWGERRCILFGGIMVTLGHFLMAGPVIWPTIIEYMSGFAVDDAIKQSGVVLGKLSPMPQDVAAMAAAFDNPSAAKSWLVAAYYLKSWSVLLGLALIVLGTGFIKATISSIVDKLYDKT
ncbi:MAG: hypothetical protein ACRCY3_02925, partial [Sphingorhabdus sp.]